MNSKHPHKFSLYEYAEGWIDSTARLDPEVASHVSSCGTCQHKVDEIRGGLEVVEGVETIEACGDLKASILLAARNTRAMTIERVGSEVFGRLAFAAGLVLLAGFSWDAVDQRAGEFSEGEFADEAQVARAEVLPAMNVLPSKVEALLTDAVMGSHREPVNDWERAQYRRLHAYDDDIAEAELALASNPGLMRASNIVASSRERKDRTLRDVYIESQ
ncbi:MAG: hypothetical protein VCB26_05580 [Candidatus Hydrogenedentota bacterium]|jgi:hypothetical protein